MATLSNILLDKEILLESGTNELEVLVFDVAHYTFGINVAKVREVLPAAQITALPRAHRSIRGVFKLRNHVIPCVSLLEHLGIVSSRENSESTMILTDLNQQQTAFLVDGVERIHRLSWEHILPVPGLEALSHTPVTALARCGERLILMLDFEMILDDVTSQYFRTDEVANPLGPARGRACCWRRTRPRARGNTRRAAAPQPAIRKRGRRLAVDRTTFPHRRPRGRRAPADCRRGDAAVDACTHQADHSIRSCAYSVLPIRRSSPRQSQRMP